MLLQARHAKPPAEAKEYSFAAHAVQLGVEVKKKLLLIALYLRILRR